jgi:hypothetical protein
MEVLCTNVMVLSLLALETFFSEKVAVLATSNKRTLKENQIKISAELFSKTLHISIALKELS